MSENQESSLGQRHEDAIEATDTPSKPSIDDFPLTFSDLVTERVKREYKAADNILEYGSGGSTVLASQLTGKSVFCIESDKLWCNRICEAIENAYPDADTTTHYVDIGKTKAWGRPANRNASANWHKYALAPWQDGRNFDPELILIDGRFRVACFFASLLNIKRPARLLFDDYYDRPHYHIVEKFASVVDRVERMAIFDIAPHQYTNAQFVEMIPYFADSE